MMNFTRPATSLLVAIRSSSNKHHQQQLSPSKKKLTPEELDRQNTTITYPLSSISEEGGVKKTIRMRKSKAPVLLHPEDHFNALWESSVPWDATSTTTTSTSRQPLSRAGGGAASSTVNHGSTIHSSSTPPTTTNHSKQGTRLSGKGFTANATISARSNNSQNNRRRPSINSKSILDKTSSTVLEDVDEDQVVGSTPVAQSIASTFAKPPLANIEEPRSSGGDAVTLHQNSPTLHTSAVVASGSVVTTAARSTAARSTAASVSSSKRDSRSLPLPEHDYLPKTTTSNKQKIKTADLPLKPISDDKLLPQQQATTVVSDHATSVTSMIESSLYTTSRGEDDDEYNKKNDARQSVHDQPHQLPGADAAVLDPVATITSATRPPFVICIPAKLQTTEPVAENVNKAEVQADDVQADDGSDAAAGSLIGSIPKELWLFQQQQLLEEGPGERFYPRAIYIQLPRKKIGASKGVGDAGDNVSILALDPISHMDYHDLKPPLEVHCYPHDPLTEVNWWLEDLSTTSSIGMREKEAALLKRDDIHNDKDNVIVGCDYSVDTYDEYGLVDAEVVTRHRKCINTRSRLWWRRFFGY